MTRTTYQQHARLERKIINMDQGGSKVLCAWDECDRHAISLYEVRMHEHIGAIGCDSAMARHVTYPFCTEKHKQYFLACTGEMAKDTEARNNGRIAGMLPPGYKTLLS